MATSVLREYFQTLNHELRRLLERLTTSLLRSSGVKDTHSSQTSGHSVYFFTKWLLYSRHSMLLHCTNWPKRSSLASTLHLHRHFLAKRHNCCLAFCKLTLRNGQQSTKSSRCRKSSLESLSSCRVTHSKMSLRIPSSTIKTFSKNSVEHKSL